MSTTISEKSFAADARYCNFYNGGDIAWSSDGTRLFCLNTNEVQIVDVQTSEIKQTISVNTTNDNQKSAQDNTENDVDDDVIYTFALAADNEQLVTAHRSGLLRLWSITTGKVIKLWKSQHKGPVVKIEFSTCCQLICTSGADSSLRLWDFNHLCCLGALRGFTGPSLLLRFHPNEKIKRIYAAGSDNTIYCWNYTNMELVYQMRGHISQVTGFSFENSKENCQYLVSVSRDKMLIVWQLSDGTQLKIIPMFEELEGVIFDQEKSQNLIVASAQGGVKLVNYKKAEISTLIESSSFEIKYLLNCTTTKQLAIVTAEQNILIYEYENNETLKCIKQLIGFNDEILDLCFLGAKERFLAVVTNSKNFKLYDTLNSMNCKIFSGHKDTVMTIATCTTQKGDNLLLTAGKDYSIRLWQLDVDAFELTCIAKNPNSHTSTIGCIAFGHHSTNTFASVCQDGSMKVWAINKKKTEQTYLLQLKYSVIAHEKDVNCVAFSPNNKIIGTASQDKTAKLWNSEKQELFGVLRGHSRGVWCIRFSPIDRIVMTSSSDSSIRLWSLSNLSCLKRLEQECTILRSDFTACGKFIISSASDGLIKIWNIKTNACVHTLEEHNDRIWSLAVPTSTGKYFYSGGADSKLIKWVDNTDDRRNAELDKQQAYWKQEQLLQSLLQQNENMEKAFLLALSLGKPKTTYNIIRRYVQLKDTKDIEKIISNLNEEHRNTLLDHVKAWSTNSRQCKVANLILHYILGNTLANPSQRLYNTSNMVEVLTPYVQRHFDRVTELSKNLTFLEFIIDCI